MTSLSSSQSTKHFRLVKDLRYFLNVSGLKIKNKLLGKETKLTLNAAQLHIHTKLEEQLNLTGKVRALIVKGRQQGASTYMGARFYHRASRRKYKKVYILTHESDATKTLFKMIEDMHESVESILRPELDESNEKRLIFKKLKSEYQVGTAGNKAGGRSSSIDFFHGSEVAFWKNTDSIKSGVMEAIRGTIGSESVLESTANGLGGMFYEMCMDALKGLGEYIVIFVPWFWQEEYREREKPRGYSLTEEDREYQKTHELEDEQMYWRFNKIINLKSRSLFKQEYPATIIEAFQSTGEGLITPASISNARKSKLKDKHAPLAMGVDPARKKDRAAIAFRRGREVPSVRKIPRTNDDMVLVGVIAADINKHKPVKCFIDCTNSFAIYDRLVELGYGKIVEAVQFSAGAFESTIYINKRIEMWIALRDYIQEESPNIPDNDELHADLSVMPDKVATSSKWKLPSKQQIKVDCGFSPDLGDALALTFAAPLPVRSLPTGQGSVKIKKQNGLKAKRRH